MLKTTALVMVVAGAATTGLAQTQQAGSADMVNAEETFQKLVDQCDDIDMLMLRAKLRLQVSRTTEEASVRGNELLVEGFELCGEGKIDEGKAKLEEALVLTTAGADEIFATEDTSSQPEEETSAEGDEGASKPWWKVW
ncbi:MAG: hypothetical protein AAFR93_06585 [Pseudomonadota bacterium]